MLLKIFFPETVSLDQDIVKNFVLLLFDRVLRKFHLPTINSYFLNKKVFMNLMSINQILSGLIKDCLLYPKTLKKLRHLNPEIKIIHYSPDDMMNPANQTKSYLNSISSV